VIGRTVSHYRITSLLGGGGMGVVYRAEDLNLGRTVALKFLPPELTRDAEAKLRFEREARAASLLDHPNICTIFDFGDANGDGQMYMAMPCYDGESLAETIDRGPVSVDEAVRIIEQIARGLGKAHAAGIVHRDIKPANVMITADGIVKILDFGLAKLAVASNITKSHTTMGTAAYMAPEQIRGEPVGPQADIWSLGIVLFELLTGRRPFRGEYAEALTYAILNEQPASLPGKPELDRVYKRMLRKDPMQRYQTADEVLADLEPFKAGSISSSARPAAERERLKSGARLGPYQIVSPIAGEVYLARDTRLDREVAIKVLSPDSPDKERFRSEAKTISHLHASTICTLFDVGEQEGVDYLVMERLDGETLAQKRMPLPIPQVLKIGAQIAEGLTAAHKQGVVHRNVTPSNVMITKAGTVKLLNFGMPSRVTSYTAPEQVEGEDGDARSDIFSLGVLLYEMSTGKQAFSGASRTALVAAILEREPAPPVALRSAIPPALDRLIRTCLEKNPDDRMQTAHDVGLQLRSMTEIGTVPLRRRVPWRAMLIAAAVLAAVAGGYALSRVLARGAKAAPRTFTQLTFTDGVDMFPTLAPDGKSFAYVSSQGGRRHIYLQRVDGRTPIDLTSDSPADDSEPAFSPDGAQIAFRSEREGGGIYVMGATGESPKRLTDFGHNPSWSPDSRQIVISTLGVELQPRSRGGWPSELWLIDTRTTTRRPLVQRGAGGTDFGRESDAVQPSWSPHGGRIAFWGLSDPQNHRQIWTIDPNAAQPKRTVQRVTSDLALHWNPIWSPDGKYLYYGSDQDGTLNLWRIPMDEATGKPTGAPEPLSLPAANSGHFSVSKEGDLAYVAMARGFRLLTMSFDATTGRTGPPQSLFGTSQEIMSFHPARDQQSIAFTAVGGANESLFIANADGTRLRRLTNDAKARTVKWSPDGKMLYLQSNRDGPYRLWSIHADGSGLSRITDDGDLKRHGIQDIYLADLSPDGRTVSAWTDHAVALVHLDRPITNRVETLGFTMDVPRFSPDGTELLGHATDPRSGATGIDVYSIPNARHQRVLDHGNTPMWLPDGKHIVYFERQNIGILDLVTHRITTAPFVPFPGSRSDSDQFLPYLSNDGSTLYMRQPVERGNIWMLRFQK